VDLEGSTALGPVKEKLEDLTRQRSGFESSLEELDSTISSVRGKAVNQETVLAALNRFKEI
jgi:prefoldin subunit 5